MPGIDSNSNMAAQGVTDNASLTPSIFKVDPVTGALLCVNVGGTVGGVVSTRIPVDGNDVEVACGVTDDANQDVRPLLTTTEGYLLISS